MMSERRELKPVQWLIFGLSLLATPAWGGGYTVEQLFLMPLDELMAVTVEMVIPPRY